MNTRRYPGRQRGEDFEEGLCAEAAADSTSPGRLQELAKKGGAIALEVARNPGTPDAVLAALAASGKDLLLCALIQNPATPKEVLRPLFASSCLWLQRALALYIHDESLLAEFEKSQSLAIPVRKALAQNMSTPPSLLRMFPRWEHLIYKSRNLLAAQAKQDPSCLAPYLTSVSQTPDLWLRSALQVIAAAPDTSPETLLLLAKISAELHEALARNSSTPKALLEEWATGKNARLQRIVVANPSLSPETLVVLSSKSNLRFTIAANPSAPAALLATYSTTSNLKLLIALAKNPNILPRTLRALAESRMDLIRQKGPSYEIDGLALLNALALHPKTAKETLQELAKSAVTSIREVARQQLSSRYQKTDES
jgi:hypothetical protein